MCVEPSEPKQTREAASQEALVLGQTSTEKNEVVTNPLLFFGQSQVTKCVRNTGSAGTSILFFSPLLFIDMMQGERHECKSGGTANSIVVHL